MVDAYWGERTVPATTYLTRRGSARQLELRFRTYPLFREFSGLWGDHSGEVVLDYGCGPGNDLTGLMLYANPTKVVGMDVSEKALLLAAQRLALHGVESERVELIQVSDADERIPLPDNTVDHVNCQGVIHHASAPSRLIAELARVLKPGGTGCVMAYNRDSVWYHLCVAYVKMVLEGAFDGLDADAAFARSTDGTGCPVSLAWTATQFVEMCAEAGLRAEYHGGYPSLIELDSLRVHGSTALEDPRLDDEHRRFLHELEIDAHGYPLYRGYHAGLGGVYRLVNRSE